MSDDRQVPVLRAFSVAHLRAAAPTQEADEWDTVYEMQHQQYGQLVELIGQITHHRVTDCSTVNPCNVSVPEYSSETLQEDENPV